MRRFTSLMAASVSVITGVWVSVFVESIEHSLRLLRFGLLLIVGQCSFDRVFGQDRTVDLHRWQVQFLDDVSILDLLRLFDCFPLSHSVARLELAIADPQPN